MNVTHMITNAGPMKASKDGGVMKESGHRMTGSSGGASTTREVFVILVGD